MTNKDEEENFVKQYNDIMPSIGNDITNYVLSAEKKLEDKGIVTPMIIQCIFEVSVRALINTGAPKQILIDAIKHIADDQNEKIRIERNSQTKH